MKRVDWKGKEEGRRVKEWDGRGKGVIVEGGGGWLEGRD